MKQIHRDAVQRALNFLVENGQHDQHCEIFDLDEEGRHRNCSCGLEETTGLLRAALECKDNTETEIVEPGRIVASPVKLEIKDNYDRWYEIDIKHLEDVKCKGWTYRLLYSLQGQHGIPCDLEKNLER